MDNVRTARAHQLEAFAVGVEKRAPKASFVIPVDASQSHTLLYALIKIRAETSMRNVSTIAVQITASPVVTTTAGARKAPDVRALQVDAVIFQTLLEHLHLDTCAVTLARNA